MRERKIKSLREKKNPRKGANFFFVGSLASFDIVILFFFSKLSSRVFSSIIPEIPSSESCSLP
jgi:hypothetical protein